MAFPSALPSGSPSCASSGARALALALIAVAGACAGGSDDPSDGTAPVPGAILYANLEPLATSVVEVRTSPGYPSYTAYTVRESDAGSAVLNGDGDSSDEVLFVVAGSRPAGLNVGFAVDAFELDGPLLVFTVPEDAHGADLDGDGDTDDRILHSLHLETGLLRNLLLQVSLEGGGKLAPVVQLQQRGSHLAVLARNDDSLAPTLQLVDLLSGTIVDTGVQPSLGRGFASEDHYVMAVRELVFGADLNGDGDLADDVVHRVDVTTGSVINFGLASGSSLGVPTLAYGEELLAIGVNEAMQGADLNGDGFTNDNVLYLHEWSSGATMNTGVAITSGHADVTIVGSRVVTRDEFGRLVVWSMEDGTVIPTPNELAQSVAATDIGVLFGIDENGVADLNGDGDALDDVMHFYDFESGLTQNLELAAAPTGLRAGGRPVLHALEAEQLRDLNEDGDQLDSVLYVWTRESGVLRLAEGGFPVATLGGGGAPLPGAFVPSVVLSVVPESPGVDLNGDGDVLDGVLHATSIDIGVEPLNLGLAVPPTSGPEVPDDLVVYPLFVDEASQGEVDLNGDGDAEDVVLVLVEAGVAR